jgi:hypothetical protein
MHRDWSGHSPSTVDLEFLVERLPLNTSATSIIQQITLPTVASPNMIGRWEISVSSETQNKTWASFDLLLLPREQNQWLNIPYLTIFNEFWSTEAMCSMNLEGSRCNAVLTRTMTACAGERWSSFYADVKSDWWTFFFGSVCKFLSATVRLIE